MTQNIEIKKIEEVEEKEKQKKKKKLFWIIFVLTLALIMSIVAVVVWWNIKNKNQKKTPEPTLAVVLVDALVAGGEQERYLTGYRIEYHKSDIANTAKTPDINADLRFAEYLKFTYTITNYTKSEMLYYVEVEKNYEEQNLKLYYSLDSGAEEQFKNNYIAGQIEKGKKICIDLYVKIEDNTLDADLSGKFSLSITYFADDAEINEE